ncbi:hypothetical protein [Clostridium polynesiense]|uniref:hypothetical protein n=1 Tax=Clostridium polynesiense TaxID=1325933 RepID=UPI00058B7710|nr:hypothetical protein [Clostridium polynesiense]
MGKPSIFSKEYERRKKKRRKRIAFLVLLVIISTFSLLYWSPVSKFFTNSQLYKELQAKYKDSEKNQNPPSNEQNNNLSGNKDAKNEEENNTKKSEEKYFEIKLPDGTNARAVYEQDDSSIKFKYLTGNDKTSFDISPSGKKMIILDGTTQDLIELSIDNSIKDLTYKVYTTRNKSKIYKDKKLSQNPQFQWHSSPKYVSEETIAYVSQMPWFKTEKYVWLVDSTAGNHRYVKNIKGSEIKFGNLTNKGLEVIIDGETIIIDSEGKTV